MVSKLIIFVQLTLTSVFFVLDADAHSLVYGNSGFGSGFSHPILGADHFLAMLAVGIWGAQMGGRRIWSLPMSFPIIMCIGAIIAMTKLFTFVFVEQIIALSVIALGLVILVKWSPNVVVAILIISVFAIFHGYAHGVELPKAKEPLSYVVGFVLSTGLIHLLGVGIGYFFEKFYSGKISKIIGLLIFIIGVLFFYRIYI